MRFQKRCFFTDGELKTGESRKKHNRKVEKTQKNKKKKHVLKNRNNKQKKYVLKNVVELAGRTEKKVVLENGEKKPLRLLEKCGSM